MNDFEERALKLAAKSPCEKRKVGAIVVAKDTITNDSLLRAFYFEGVNHHPNGECCELENGSTKLEVIHAEVAALKGLKEWCNSCTDIPYTDWFLYVTHQPCDNCLSVINTIEQQYPIVINIKVVEQFMKFDTDKLRYDLIPPSAMKALAEVLTYGAKKYKPNNWRNGDKDRYIAALYRHLEAWRAGEQKDEESGMVHLAHALTNVAFLLELDSSTSKELDNGNK